FEPYKFIDSEFKNCSFFHNKTGCQITFDDDYSAYWIYFVNFLGTLAVLPGNIVSALLMDRIGRLTMLGGSMVLSGISCFFLWFGTSESMMIGMLCLYNGLTISAWNSLDVVTVELYPTDRRATGFGFLNALCKAAAVLGNLIFGSLVSITKSIPILLASTVLVCGGLVGLRLPDTRTQLLNLKTPVILQQQKEICTVGNSEVDDTFLTVFVSAQQRCFLSDFEDLWDGHSWHGIKVARIRSRSLRAQHSTPERPGGSHLGSRDSLTGGEDTSVFTNKVDGAIPRLVLMWLDNIIGDPDSFHLLDQPSSVYWLLSPYGHEVVAATLSITSSHT
ncbi:hypothetical protein H8959_022227, partial [Pygathrix nigripes]